MYYHAASDRYIQPGQSFTLGEVQYPSNWLTTVSTAEKAAIGLVEVQVVGEHKDPTYYNNSEVLFHGVLTKSYTERADLTPAKTQIKNLIDSVAGSARASYLSQGEHVIREYDQAYSEALAYKDAGYPVSPVPLSVSCWATASATTNTAAADNIIAQGDFLKLKLDQIREVRLVSKAAIDSASTVSELIDSKNSALIALEALRNVS